MPAFPSLPAAPVSAALCPPPPLRLVLDTNIVIDTFLFRSELSAPLREALAAGRVELFASPATLSELERVLGYPVLKISAERQAAGYGRYLGQFCECSPIQTNATIRFLPRCRDRDDQVFIELAAAICADWLISRDKEVLRVGRNKRNPPPFRIADLQWPELVAALAGTAGTPDDSDGE